MASSLARYALRRAALGAASIWLAATVAFLLVLLVPGGPAVALAGDHAAPGYVEEMTRAYGLDRPRSTIYLDWLGRALRGDLGVSYRAQVPVLSLIAERAPVTMALMLPALALSALAGLLIGLATSGPRRGSRLIAGVLASLHAVPSYVVAQLLVLVFALGLRWFPVQGLVDPHLEPGSGRVLDMARHLALPILALATAQFAFVALVVRARMSEELRRPYVTTALAKGLSLARVKLRHALANAALPLVTLIGWRFGSMVGGSVVIETLFALPGLGRLAVTSAMARDVPTVIGIVLVTCTVVVAVNLVVDLAASCVDPRLREGFR